MRNPLEINSYDTQQARPNTELTFIEEIPNLISSYGIVTQTTPMASSRLINLDMNRYLDEYK